MKVQRVEYGQELVKQIDCPLRVLTLVFAQIPKVRS
jgi:hypothetical protein